MKIVRTIRNGGIKHNKFFMNCIKECPALGSTEQKIFFQNKSLRKIFYKLWPLLSTGEYCLYDDHTGNCGIKQFLWIVERSVLHY